MKHLLFALILLITTPTFAQEPIGTYHTNYGKVYQVYYDSQRGKAYYNRTAKAKFYFSKKVTAKFLVK